MIADTIQLAVAPVFLLVAVGNLLNVLSSRLGRVVDRSRKLQERHGKTHGPEHDMVVREIRMIDRRITLIDRAILLLVLSGLAVGVTVTLLFLQDFFGTDLIVPAAAGFLLAIGFLMTALLYLLRETREAGRALRIPADFLELERKL